MASIIIIAGKNLKSAINSFGKQAATFAEKQHQLAASAVAHLNNGSNDPKYCQMLYDVTPLNYRPALREWIVNFGKCRFVAIDKDTKAPVNKFEYAKGKKIEPEIAARMLDVSPSEFAKAKGKGKGTGEGQGTGGKGTGEAYDYVAAIQSVAKRLESLMQTFSDEKVPPAIEEMLEVLHGKAESTVKAATKWRMANTVPAATAPAEIKPEAAPAAPVKSGRKPKTAPAALAPANDDASKAA